MQIQLYPLQWCFVKSVKHLRRSNTYPRNFRTERALVSQPSTLVIASDCIISYQFISIIILAII